MRAKHNFCNFVHEIAVAGEMLPYVLDCVLQEFCNWAYSKNFDIEDDVDSQDEGEDE